MSEGHETRLGASLDAIAPRLETRFRVHRAVPWGFSIPYFQVASEVGPLVVAALPLECTRDPELERRFPILAAELAAMSGPAFPRVVRYGIADGVPFVGYRPPMGRPLSERLERGPLASRTVLRILEGILDALAAAHRLGLVHGELRPENVLVEESGERLCITLLGVGLFPLLEEARQRAGTRRSGAAPAISSYRAPELLGGGLPTAASDLYALGALVHHMVSGRPPGRFETSDAYEDLPSLVDVVRRAMATEPDERYASAESMRSALDWVEIDSEKMHAHTQDIPLWMEHSRVGSIPVPELLRSRSSAPPRSDRAPRASVEPIARMPPPPRLPRFSEPPRAAGLSEPPRAAGFSEPPPPRDIFSAYPPLAPTSDSTEPSLQFELVQSPSEHPPASVPSYPPSAYAPPSRAPSAIAQGTPSPSSVPLANEPPRASKGRWIEPAIFVGAIALTALIGFWLAR